jgi:iron(III) transport system substrate-binding protein
MRIHSAMRAASSRLVLLGALVAGVTVLTGTGPDGAAARDLPQGVRAILDAAKQEGTVTFFGQSLNPDQIAAFERGFEDFYGFAVNLNISSGMHPAKAASVAQGARLGVASGLDIFWTSSVIAATLDKADLIADVDWAALGADPDLVWGGKGLRANDATLPFVIYNTSLLKLDQAPKSYADLLNPIYKGRIAFPRSPVPFVYMAYAIGVEEGERILRGVMKEQDAKMLPTVPDVQTRVATGEFAIGIGIDAWVAMRRGAPVSHAPIEPVVLTPWAFWLMKDAKHPNAGKLWAYWMTTDEGQKVLIEVRAWSRVNVEGSPLWKHAQGHKVVIVPHDYSAHEITIRDRYQKIMGLR